MYVDWNHLLAFDAELSEAIELEFYRFEPFLRDAVREFIGKDYPSYIWASEDAGRGEKKDFFISFYNLPCIERIRALRTDRIGKLLSVSGTVTRTSEVRPELLAGTFTCCKCGQVEKNVAQNFQYTKPLFCKNSVCNNPNEFELDMAASRFVDWSLFLSHGFQPLTVKSVFPGSELRSKKMRMKFQLDQCRGPLM